MYTIKVKIFINQLILFIKIENMKYIEISYILEYIVYDTDSLFDIFVHKLKK